MSRVLLAGATILTIAVIAAACGRAPDVAPATSQPIPPTSVESPTQTSSRTPTLVVSPTELPPRTPTLVVSPTELPPRTPAPVVSPTKVLRRTPTPAVSPIELPTTTPADNPESTGGTPLVGPSVGNMAPGFKLASASGPHQSMESYRGNRNLVVVFYRAFW